MFVFGNQLIHLIAMLSASGFMIPLYLMKLPIIEKQKSTQNQWPWDDKSFNWNWLISKNLFLLVINLSITFPITMVILLMINNWEVRFMFDNENLPDWQKIMATIVFSVLCEDGYFYFSHKFMHWAPVYPYVHKVHHDHINSVNLASEHLHPIEFIFAGILPAGIASLVLDSKMHYYTLILWTFWRVFETNFLHCGYNFSWSPFDVLPFMVSSHFHDFHHTDNLGNYG